MIHLAEGRCPAAPCLQRHLRLDSQRCKPSSAWAACGLRPWPSTPTDVRSCVSHQCSKHQACHGQGMIQGSSIKSVAVLELTPFFRANSRIYLMMCCIFSVSSLAHLATTPFFFPQYLQYKGACRMVLVQICQNMQNYVALWTIANKWHVACAILCR
jgi:hypothetical protein